MAMGTIRGAQLAVGKNGRVHVAWDGMGRGSSLDPHAGHSDNHPAHSRPAHEPSGDKHPLFYTRLNDDTTGFEPERNVITYGHCICEECQRQEMVSPAVPLGCLPAVSLIKIEQVGTYFSRFHTDKVRPSPGLLVKSVGRSASGLPKHDLSVSPSISYIPSCFLPLVKPSVIW